MLCVHNRCYTTEVPFTEMCCSTLGPWIAKRRTPDVQKKYSEIGGGSPILQWTNKQGELLCTKLDKISPETAPHKHYVAFRYADPLTEETLERIRKYGRHTCNTMQICKCESWRISEESVCEFVCASPFSATVWSILYYFLSILSIVAQLQAPVSMLYTIITKLGDYFLSLTSHRSVLSVTHRYIFDVYFLIEYVFIYILRVSL